MPTILTKKSDTPGSIPATANLTNAAGGAELAVNTADKRLFTITSGSQVVELGTNPASLTCADVSATVLRAGSATITNLLATSLTVSSGSTLNGGVVINESGADADTRIEGDTDANLFFADASTDRIGVGTNTPAVKLDVGASVNDSLIARVVNTNSGNLASGRLYVENNDSSFVQMTTYSSGFEFGVFGITAANYSSLLTSGANSNGLLIGTTTATPIVFGTNATERARITAAGDVGIGTTNPGTKLSVNGAAQIMAGNALNFQNAAADSNSSIVNSNSAGASNIAFNTGGTERARISSGGSLLVGKTAVGSLATAGCEIEPAGTGVFTVSAAPVVIINRLTDDGVLINFYQATTVEGNISVSGNTVSYNAFAGSHWSQLQDGSKPDILRGTVMESINELCEWPDEVNERLPKSKISDTAGSKKVYGVFMAWDNDWTATNDMYVTAVGAFICRVNGSVTVQEGDLLESNGDGTARVQADDIIRSSTIGKVTSTVKTHQYDDGSYCVPTVLYCG